MESYPTTRELVKRASEARNANKVYFNIIDEKTVFWDGEFYTHNPETIAEIKESLKPYAY